MTENKQDQSTAPAQPAAEGGGAQPESQAPATQPSTEFDTLQWDGVPREVWSLVNDARERGDLDPSVVEGWRENAKLRQTRYANDLAERRRLLKVVTEGGTQTNGQSEGGSTSGNQPERQTEPASLRAALGEDAEQLGNGTVEALDRAVDERVQARVEEALRRMNVQPQADPREQMIAQQTARQRERLGERFPGLAANPHLMGEIETRAEALAGADPSYQALPTLDERFDAAYRDAAAIVAQRYPELSQAPYQPQAQQPSPSVESTPPAQPAPSQRSSQAPTAAFGGGAGSRPAAAPQLTGRDAKIAAARAFARTGNVDSARRAGGLPPLT